MTHPVELNHVFPIKRSAALLVGLGVLISGATAAALVGLGKTDQLLVALSCGGVCLLAALVALIPMGRLAAHGDHCIVQGAMIGLMVRLFGSLAGVAILKAALDLETRALAWWALGWYAAFLVVEVLIMVNFLRPASVNANVTAEQAAC